MISSKRDVWWPFFEPKMISVPHIEGCSLELRPWNFDHTQVLLAREHASNFHLQWFHGSDGYAIHDFGSTLSTVQECNMIQRVLYYILREVKKKLLYCGLGWSYKIIVQKRENKLAFIYPSSVLPPTFTYLEPLVYSFGSSFWYWNFIERLKHLLLSRKRQCPYTLKATKCWHKVIEHEYLWVVVEYNILKPIHVLKKWLALVTSLA